MRAGIMTAIYQLATTIVAGIAAGFEWNWRVGLVVFCITYALTPQVTIQ